MFLTNRTVVPQEQEMDWGKYRFLQFGQFGQGVRKPINIAVPADFTDMIQGNVEYPYAIKLSVAGKPKLGLYEDNKKHILIDTYSNKFSDEDGRIEVLQNQIENVDVLALGYSAFGERKECVNKMPACLMTVRYPIIIRYKIPDCNWSALYVQDDDNLVFFDDMSKLWNVLDKSYKNLAKVVHSSDWISVENIKSNKEALVTK